VALDIGVVLIGTARDAGAQSEDALRLKRLMLEQELQNESRRLKNQSAAIQQQQYFDEMYALVKPWLDREKLCLAREVERLAAARTTAYMFGFEIQAVCTEARADLVNQSKLSWVRTWLERLSDKQRTDMAKAYRDRTSRN
jgi:hypothetical protein